MSRYIAKCQACNAVTSGLSEGQHCHRAKEDPAREGAVYTYEPTKGQPAQAVPGGLVLDCRLCGRPWYAKVVQGRFSAKHRCGARCLSATGTTCECSCAGKNHGADHGVSL